MLASMNGYHGAGVSSTFKRSSMHHYQSSGDLRTLNSNRSTSWHDGPPGAPSSMPGSRPLGSSAALSRSMNQLNQSTTYQHTRPTTAGSYQLPQYKKVTGHGRVTVPQATHLHQQQVQHHQYPSVMSSASTTMHRDVGGTYGRQRRRRNVIDSTSGWYPTENESVFSEPPSASVLYRQPDTPNDGRLRQPISSPLRHQPQHRALHQHMSSSSSVQQRRSSPEPSAIDPELRNVGKTGDNYHITMSLNAALRQAELQQQQLQQQQSQVTMTDRLDSRSNAPNWNEMTPSSQSTSRVNLTVDNTASSHQTVIASTTVVHVKDEDVDQTIPTRPSSNSTTLVEHQPVKRHQPVQPVRSSEGGYRIKSVKSMSDLRDIDDLQSTSSQSKRRFVAGGDDKVGFDVEVKNSWRPSSVMETRTPAQSKQLYTKQTETIGSRQIQKVFDGNPPSYTMTLNDTMSMNYAPISDGQEWSQKKTVREVSDSSSNVARRSNRPQVAAKTTSMAAPKLFYEQSTQMNGDVASSRDKVEGAPRRVIEQSTQASDPVSVSTQTNKERGTQTDKSNDIPMIETSPLQSAPNRPNSGSDDNKRLANQRATKNEPPTNAPSIGLGMNTDDPERRRRGSKIEEELDDITVFDRLINIEKPAPVPAKRRPMNTSEVPAGSGNRTEIDHENCLDDPLRTFDRLISTDANSRMFPNDQLDGVAVVQVSNVQHAKPSSPRDNGISGRSSASREGPFGYRGNGKPNDRSDFARKLMEGVPSGSVIQKERRDVEEETISRSMIGGLDYEGRQDNGHDSDAELNLDSVSEKVDLVLADGVAELTILVRCERIIPVRDTPDLFKKSTVNITKVIEVNLLVTNERRQLYETIVANQRQSATGRLSNRDTFDLYQTFMEMAKQDAQSGRGAQQQVHIDRQVDEQRFFDLQLSSRNESGRRDTTFDRIDRQLNAVHSSADVDVRSQSKLVRRVNRQQ